MSCSGVTPCTDLYAMIIQAILNLGAAKGSTIAEIYAELPTVCPTGAAYSEAQVTNAVNKAAKRGILSRIFASVAATPTFMVNAYMTNFNYLNKVYSRCLCGSA
jgi:hypothetical protein